jgi:hypothetical protein
MQLAHYDNSHILDKYFFSQHSESCFHIQLTIGTEFSAAPCRLAEVERTNASNTGES